jgi:hypothetical protein
MGAGTSGAVGLADLGGMSVRLYDWTIQKYNSLQPKKENEEVIDA